jgi:hypothetical protein
MRIPWLTQEIGCAYTRQLVELNPDAPSFRV